MFKHQLLLPICPPWRQQGSFSGPNLQWYSQRLSWVLMLLLSHTSCLKQPTSLYRTFPTVDSSTCNLTTHHFTGAYYIIWWQLLLHLRFNPWWQHDNILVTNFHFIKYLDSTSYPQLVQLLHNLLQLHLLQLQYQLRWHNVTKKQKLQVPK